MRLIAVVGLLMALLSPAAPVQAADPFGEQITLTQKTVIVTKGTANWDTAFETLIASLKALSAALEKDGGKSAGNSMIVYTSTDDTGFSYLAEIPVDQEPKNLPKTINGSSRARRGPGAAPS